MSEAHKTTWIHNAMLLGSLAAGTFATQLVPAYQDHVGTVTYPSRAAALRSHESGASKGGFSQTIHHGAELTSVRSSS
jgi:hypothetical protein